MRVLSARNMSVLHGRMGLACTILLLSLPASASYLDELQQEAKRSFDSPTTPTPQPRSSAPARSPGDTISPLGAGDDRVESGLDKAGFEEALRSNFYGSYLFYSALGNPEQQEVYQEYTNNNDIEYLREIIKAKIK